MVRSYAGLVTLAPRECVELSFDLISSQLRKNNSVNRIDTIAKNRVLFVVVSVLDKFLYLVRIWHSKPKRYQSVRYILIRSKLLTGAKIFCTSTEEIAVCKPTQRRLPRKSPSDSVRTHQLIGSLAMAMIADCRSAARMR